MIRGRSFSAEVPLTPPERRRKPDIPFTRGMNAQLRLSTVVVPEMRLRGRMVGAVEIHPTVDGRAARHNMEAWTGSSILSSIPRCLPASR